MQCSRPGLLQEQDVTPVNNDLTQLIDTEWKKIRPEPGRSSADRPMQFWEYTVSPPLPARWPQDADSRIIRYLYATCFDPQIADGIRVAAPWGCIETTKKDPGSSRFIRSSGTVREIGIQGVRPLSKAELEVYETGGRAESCLVSLAGIPDEHEPDTAVVRMYYRTWCGHNGVIAQELFSFHEPFFRWIGYQK